MKMHERPARRPGHEEASAAFTAAFATARFPASKDDLRDQVGAWRVPLGDGRTATLGDLLAGMPSDSFASTQDAVNKVDQHWERMAAAVGEAEVHAGAKHRGGKGRAEGREAPDE